MKRLGLIFSLLAALQFAALPAYASWLINSFSVASTLPTKSFQACTASTSNLTTYTFSSHAIGTDTGANRTILVGIASNDLTTVWSVSTLTVGGTSAIADVTSSDADRLEVAIYHVTGVSGSTGDIVVTFDEAVEWAAVCVWAVYDLTSSTAGDTASATNSAAPALTLDLDVQANGVAVGMCVTRDGQTFTWIGLTEDADSGDAEKTKSAASLNPSTASTPLTASCDGTGTAASAGASASYR